MIYMWMCILFCVWIVPNSAYIHTILSRQKLPAVFLQFMSRPEHTNRYHSKSWFQRCHTFLRHAYLCDPTSNCCSPFSYVTKWARHCFIWYRHVVENHCHFRIPSSVEVGRCTVWTQQTGWTRRRWWRWLPLWTLCIVGSLRYAWARKPKVLGTAKERGPVKPSWSTMWSEQAEWTPRWRGCGRLQNNKRWALRNVKLWL